MNGGQQQHKKEMLRRLRASASAALKIDIDRLNNIPPRVFGNELLDFRNPV